MSSGPIRGVRSLYDEGASSASAATRDYVLKLDDAGAPVLNVFGGKITTHRVLAEDALDKIARYLSALEPKWTAGVPMPGGDFEVHEVETLIETLHRDYPFLTPAWAKRLIRAYGTDAQRMLGSAKTIADLGCDFGATLCEVEVRYLMVNEFATTAEDIVWRRSKLGLRMDKAQIAMLDDFMQHSLEDL